jgi:ZIP family zinc transporter
VISDTEPSPILLGSIGSLLAGSATVVGALPVLVVRRISRPTQDVMLGFAAGVMLAASFFSLILPGLDAARGQGAGELGAVSIVGVGVLVGATCLWLIHRYAPHEHFILGHEGPPTERVRRIWLFIIAITLHNVPEGLAVGVGFAAVPPKRSRSPLASACRICRRA